MVGAGGRLCGGLALSAISVFNGLSARTARSKVVADFIHSTATSVMKPSQQKNATSIQQVYLNIHACARLYPISGISAYLFLLKKTALEQCG